MEEDDKFETQSALPEISELSKPKVKKVPINLIDLFGFSQIFV